jgi:peptidoglycan pentaglycine glycine transferase (the first glycine)
MQAQIITNRQQWNDFVAESAYCNITQTYEWGELLPVQGSDVLRFGVIDHEGQLCAAMLIIVTYISPLKIAYFYAPRGPIIENPDDPALDELLNFVQEEARSRHAFMLKIEPGAPDDSKPWLLALAKHGFCGNPEARHLRHEWILDIRPDEQILLAGMKKTWRYCVRQASRKGVKVHHGHTPADLDIFYKLLHITSERDTFFVYDKAFYARLMALYGDRARLLIAEYEGQPLAAALLIVHGRWCWYMYGASSNEQRERMPNHLLQWTAFQWAKQQGCWYYNFRGIPNLLEEGQPMWGVYVFKSGFGGQSIRSLETHDLAYIPIIYQIYRRILDMRLWYNKRRAQKLIMQAEQKKTVIKEVQRQRDQLVLEDKEKEAQHEASSVEEVVQNIDVKVTNARRS